MKIDVLKKLASRWPSSIVARGEIRKFSGGLLNPRTLANLDCQGRGPANRFRVGRKVAYPVSDLVLWMEGRATELPES